MCRAGLVWLARSSGSGGVEASSAGGGCESERRVGQAARKSRHTAPPPAARPWGRIYNASQRLGTVWTSMCSRLDHQEKWHVKRGHDEEERGGGLLGVGRSISWKLILPPQILQAWHPPNHHDHQTTSRTRKTAKISRRWASCSMPRPPKRGSSTPFRPPPLPPSPAAPTTTTRPRQS